MAIKLDSIYKVHVWYEWSRHIKQMSSHSVRRLFYPHKLDILDEMSKKMEQKRRNAIRSIDYLNIIGWLDTTSDERDLWYSQTLLITDYTRNIASHIVDYDISAFLETLESMENERWTQLESKMEPRLLKNLEEEAMEGLMLLQKKAHQENAKNERNIKALEQKNAPVRRSSRIQNQKTYK